MATQPIYDDATHEWSLPAEFVDCAVDGQIVQLPVADLVCAIVSWDKEDEWGSAVEFRRSGEPVEVHRSVRLHLKKAMGPLGAAQAVLA